METRSRCHHRSHATRRLASEHPAAASAPGGTEAPPDPSAALGGDEETSRDPHDSTLLHGPAVEPPDLFPRPRSPDVSTGRPRPGRRPDGCPPCCHGRRRQRRRFAPASPPARFPRSDHGRSRDPGASASRTCARETTGQLRRYAPQHVISSAHLVRSPESSASTSPSTRPLLWIRASSQFSNRVHQPVRLHRAGASPDPAAGHTSRSPRSPQRPSHRVTRRPMPDIPRCSVAAA